MSTEDVVDITGPSSGGQRRIWLRVGVPLAGVALVIVAILAVALYSNSANRAGVIRLSDSLLAGLERQISQQVTVYFEPATRAARLARDMVTRNAVANPTATFEAFAASALRQAPQADALYMADGRGDLLLVQRGATAGTDTKMIRNAPDARSVEWLHYDRSGRLTGTEQDPSDTFDPRTRGWYQGALKADDVYWTDVYVFFSRNIPGITAAIHFRGADGSDQVFGVDITLRALSDFLASLKIGNSGRAVIIDETGHLIAAPDASKMLREQDGQLVTVRADQIDDPVLAAAYDRFRVEGYGRRLIDVDGRSIVAIAASLPTAGRQWSLLMVVPEKDFTGFVTSNGRKTLTLSLSVVVLAAILAALLIRQGLRADRTTRLLLDRGRAIERQGAALAGLVQQPGLFDRSQDGAIQTLTETVADLAAARRVSVWRLLDQQRLLDCEDAFERGRSGHVAGLQITRPEMPQFFAALESGEPFAVTDAAADRRTAEAYRVLMQSFDSRRLSVVPINGAEGVLGAIILEDAARFSDAGELLGLIASMLAIRMHGTSNIAVAQRTERAAVAVATGERSLSAELAKRGLDPAAMSADVFPSVAVMVVKFSDGAALAAREPGDGSTLADHLAAALQDIAAANDIPYVKMVGHDAVLAAGYAPRDSSAIERIADAAVATRERFVELLEAAEQSPAFRIGIHYGLAFGSQIGREPRLFNLWGEAVRTADMMAASGAGAGSIQVSEAAYHQLRQHFLFRPRGSFHLPRVGTAQTFVLGSRS